MLNAEMGEYQTLLAGFAVSFVGILASLAVIEERESQRKDRMIGLARWQFDRVHAGRNYHLEIDASQDSPEVCALEIKDAFGL